MSSRSHTRSFGRYSGHLILSPRGHIDRRSRREKVTDRRKHTWQAIGFALIGAAALVAGMLLGINYMD
jgi:hypothetical protein